MQIGFPDMACIYSANECFVHLQIFYLFCLVGKSASDGRGIKGSGRCFISEYAVKCFPAFNGSAPDTVAAVTISSVAET